MDAVSSITRSPNATQRIRGVNPQSANAAAQAAKVTVSESQSSDLTLATAEGDRVTLSSSNSAELSFALYSAQGQVDGEDAVAASAQFRTSSAFSLTVEGDLNKEELKDIRRAIKTIQKASKDLLEGNEEKASARTAKLSKLDQIAGIEVTLQVQREISVAQVDAQTQEGPSTADETPSAEAVPQATIMPETQSPTPIVSSGPTYNVSLFQEIFDRLREQNTLNLRIQA